MHNWHFHVKGLIHLQMFYYLVLSVYYMFAYITVVPCPGIGQIFGTCNPVNATCSYPIAPKLCDVGFCSCPSGQVLDELTNTCINVTQCSKYIMHVV